MIASIQILLGIWRATLTLPDASLPFNFEMKQQQGKYVMEIINGDEHIRCDEITIKDDSMFVRLPVFDSEFRLKIEGKKMQGVWINYARKEVPRIIFNARYGNVLRFIPTTTNHENVAGRWETYLDAGTLDSSLAIGVFTQKEQTVNGTFLSESGDHRYLSGIVNGDTLWLSTFDGSHCWLYKGIITGDMMQGTFWSGNHNKSNWWAKRNNKIELPDANKITSVNKPLQFTFPDADSNLISLSDKRFKNKVVLLQIMGSWCPNCLDETKYFVDYYNKHHKENLEIIGLAFEKTNDFKKASANLKRLQQRYQIPYPLLIAGSTGKDAVVNALPGITNFISYPTTIFLNRKGEVVKVHAGFSGPATGNDFEIYKKEFDETVERLLH